MSEFVVENAGLIEGVKYDRIGVVLVNAVKEQQRIELEQMKVFICSQDPTLAFCRQKEQKQ